MASAENENPIFKYAGIEYHGAAGSTRDCVRAIERLIMCGEKFQNAYLITHDNGHAFLLKTSIGDLIAIKSGFGSGYLGEGAHGFAYVLQLLEEHGADIEEYEISEDVMDRLEMSALTLDDVNNLVEKAHPVRPRRYNHYIFEEYWERARAGALWSEFEPVMPLGMIDPRITDLAISFWEDPDSKLMAGYRRLEDVLRKRTGVDEHGTALFSRIFQGKQRLLCWEGAKGGEHDGRAMLFISTYMAFRNPRAHRELKTQWHQQLSELIFLNQLYVLERDAIEYKDEVE